MTLAATRDLLEDERQWVVAAVVALHDGSTSHWRILPEGHLAIEVRTLKHGVPIEAIMKGGPVFRIPSLNTEVLLNFEMGEYEGDAYVVAVHDHAPSSVSENVTLIIDSKVKIKTLGGTSKPLAFQEDLDSLADDFYGHGHLVSGTGATPGPGSLPLATPVLTNTLGDGTTVLEAE